MTTYLRYRVDASRDCGSDRLHSAREAVETEWHETEGEAIQYAEELADDDLDLILAVGEYAIDSDTEPTDDDWRSLAQSAPRREIWCT